MDEMQQFNYKIMYIIRNYNLIRIHRTWHVKFQ